MASSVSAGTGCSPAPPQMAGQSGIAHEASRLSGKLSLSAAVCLSCRGGVNLISGLEEGRAATRQSWGPGVEVGGGPRVGLTEDLGGQGRQYFRDTGLRQ